MGTRFLWDALQERDALYAKPHEQLTDADGMRLGELEGIVGEEGGYTCKRTPHFARRLGVESTLHERKMGELQGGQKVRVLLAQALFGNPARCYSTSPPTTWTLIRCTGCRLSSEYEGVLIVNLPRPPFPQQRLHSHRRYRLRNHHHVQRRLRRHGHAKTHIRARIESENSQREKENCQLNEFIARFSAGTRSAQATSRKKEVERLQTTEAR